MRSNKYLVLAISIGLIVFSSTHCGSSSSSSSTGTPCSAQSFSASSYSNVTTGTTFSNTMTLTVNGSTCDSSTMYNNEPCVSVTLCSPTNSSQCQTINNLLLDTGSYGLRIFSSVITIPLVPITSNGNTLAECVQYGDGSTQWGQVQYAYVQLGGEPMVAMPIQVIDATYSSAPSVCSSNQDVNPAQTGFNGILGVGLLAQDCGAGCVSSVNNDQYYSCTSTDCSCGATVALGAQVVNPVSQLPIDNNGVVLSLPSAASSGASSVSGTLYLGIGTQSNNSPTAGVQKYTANSNLNFTTTFSSYSSTAMTTSFIDSGSNDLFFPAPSGNALPDCSVSHGRSWSGLYCPSSTQSYTATVVGSNGSPNGGTSVSFSIGNAYSFLTNSSSYHVFPEIGGTSSTSSPFFDWGLPFFLGNTVYVGINGTSSSLGTGPYWGF